jgi:glutamate N-acetyltransferase/amino-acid N-acetyltransferase
VIRVTVSGAADFSSARALGKAIVNAPLFKCAVAGNDPNVGRLIQAIGKHVGACAPGTDVSGLRVTMGGHRDLSPAGRLPPRPGEGDGPRRPPARAELYKSAPPKDGVFAPPARLPAARALRRDRWSTWAPHGGASATVFGADLTHEYVSENADYRS